MEIEREMGGEGVWRRERSRERRRDQREEAGEAVGRLLIAKVFETQVEMLDVWYGARGSYWKPSSKGVA